MIEISLSSVDLPVSCCFHFAGRHGAYPDCRALWFHVRRSRLADQLDEREREETNAIHRRLTLYEVPGMLASRSNRTGPENFSSSSSSLLLFFQHVHIVYLNPINTCQEEIYPSDLLLMLMLACRTIGFVGIEGRLIGCEFERAGSHVETIGFFAGRARSRGWMPTVDPSCSTTKTTQIDETIHHHYPDDELEEARK